jgi:hypothetical protein
VEPYLRDKPTLNCDKTDSEIKQQGKLLEVKTKKQER